MASSPSSSRETILPSIIIGAGMSGLTAASKWHQAGMSSVILEKSRGVGGRMSRRRSEHGNFDHGAQFFEVTDSSFQQQVDRWQQQELIRNWSRGFPDLSGQVQGPGLPCYCGRDGMNSVLKDLSTGLDVRTGQRVERIFRQQDLWAVEIEDATVYQTRALLVTAPVPQALSMLEKGDVSINPRQTSALARIDYEPCLTLMVALAQKVDFSEHGGLWLSGEPLSWIADNASKGLAADVASMLTIHAGPLFSRQHWETDASEVTRIMLKAASEWIQQEPLAAHYHRWRDHQPVELFPDRMLVINQDPWLCLAGDGFGQSGVEGAYLSGMAAAEALLE